LAEAGRPGATRDATTVRRLADAAEHTDHEPDSDEPRSEQGGG
jgi:hypothetical protein